MSGAGGVDTESTESSGRGALGWLRWAAPFVVSAGIIAALLASVDVGAVLRQLTPAVAGVLLPAVGLYLGLSLWIESETLVRMAELPRGTFDRLMAARIKAASYLLALIHYALGVGTLTLLLHRRVALPLADAAGVVILISLFDIGVLLLLTAIGATFLGEGAPEMQAGVVAAAALATTAGFVFLRTRLNLGPLERVRSLQIFHAARTAPASKLMLLGALRLAFVVLFITTVGAALFAFGIVVPLADLIVGVAAILLVSALPIAVAGLGTGQVAFVYFFRNFADAETLLACSLALSVGIIVGRSILGLVFAGEFTREALANARDPGDSGHSGEMADGGETADSGEMEGI